MNIDSRESRSTHFAAISVLISLALWLTPFCSLAPSSYGMEAADSVSATPAPAEEPLSTRFALSVQDHAVPVYVTRVVALTPEQREKLRASADLSGTSDAAFSSFDFQGSVEISVTCPEKILTVKLLPSSSGITPVVSGNCLTFTLSKPAQLTLEVNGDWIHSLHLFANPIETDIPRPDDPHVIYFGPGIHEVETIKVDSGKTVYIAAGAIVREKPGTNTRQHALFLLSGSNIILRGRGIIDGTRRVPSEGAMIIAAGDNIRVEGITLRDSASWNFLVTKSDQVKIQNVKILGWRINSDGFDLCNSGNINVSDCFVRTFDDLVVIKTTKKNAGPSHDILVTRCVLWNEFAHALSLGAELRDPVKNILFSNCDIIHDKGREWDLRVYDSDSASVKNILFDDIRIEESRRLMSLWIGKAVWSKDPDRGHIDDVTFRNINSVIPTRAGSYSALQGFDTDHAIHGIQFNHVLIGGHPLQLKDIQQNEFVQQIALTP